MITHLSALHSFLRKVSPSLSNKAPGFLASLLAATTCARQVHLVVCTAHCMHVQDNSADARGMEQGSDVHLCAVLCQCKVVSVFLLCFAFCQPGLYGSLCSREVCFWRDSNSQEQVYCDCVTFILF